MHLLACLCIFRFISNMLRLRYFVGCGLRCDSLPRYTKGGIWLLRLWCRCNAGLLLLHFSAKMVSITLTILTITLAQKLSFSLSLLSALLSNSACIAFYSRLQHSLSNKRIEVSRDKTIYSVAIGLCENGCNIHQHASYKRLFETVMRPRNSDFQMQMSGSTS